MPGLAPAERARLYEENWRRAFALTQDAYARGAESNPRVVFTLAILYAVRPGGSNLDRALLFLERAIRDERTYLTRALGEPAFSSLRDVRNEPFASRFRDLLAKYRSRSGPLDARRGPYDPNVFIE